MSTTHALPLVAPEVSPEAEPFWEATGSGRLMLQRCPACSAPVWYPRGMCPGCGGTTLEWFEASGAGTVYSFTVVRRGATGAYRDVGPYVLAYVELAEGPRVLTNVVDCDPDTLEVGTSVRALFDPTPDGPSLVRFRPVAG